MTQEVYLDIDSEVDAVLGDDAAIDALIAADEERALWGLARALRREQAISAQLAREQTAIQIEYGRRAREVSKRAEALDGYIETIVLARRARGESNSVSLPGIGAWATRKVKGGWDIEETGAAEARYIEFLRAHYEAEATAIIEDKPRVMRAQLRAWLDSLDDETVVPVIEGLGEFIQARPERISVSFRAEPTREGTRDDDRAPREP